MSEATRVISSYTDLVDFDQGVQAVSLWYRLSVQGQTEANHEVGSFDVGGGLDVEAGELIRFKQTSYTEWRYAQVVSYAGSVITFKGYPAIADELLTVLEVQPGQPLEDTLEMVGVWNDANGEDIYFKTNGDEYIWRGPSAKLVCAYVDGEINDSVADSTINVRYAGGPFVFSAGLSVNSVGGDTGNTTNDNAINFGERLEVIVDNTGSDGGAEGVKLVLIWARA